MSKFVLVIVFVVIPPLANTSLSQWSQSSGPTTSTVNAFAVSEGRFYAGTVGGIYTSTDDGKSWTNISSVLAGRSVLALLAEGSRVYAGTDEGIYVSTDMGINWSTAQLSGVTFRALMQLGSRIFAASERGIFVSADRGLSWAASSSGLTQEHVYALAASGSTVFAGTSYGGSIFRSTDNGASWIECKTGMTNGYVFALATSESYLFAGTYGGVFVSTNGGNSWSASNSGLTSTSIVSLAMVGTNLLAGTNGGGVFVSTNNGNSWSVFNDSLRGRYVRALGTNQTNLLAGTDVNGIFSRSVHDLMFPIAPKNNSGGVASQATFSWKRNPRAMTYLFQLATDPSFSNIEVSAYTQDTTKVVASMQPTTVYYWRVRAEHTSGASAWGGGQLTTKLTSLVQLLSPTSSATLVSRTPALAWTPLVSTATYALQVSTRSTFDNLIYSKDTTGTSITTSQLQGLTTYYWRVRAQTPGDTTSWSSVYSFTTMPNPPNLAVLTYPDSSNQNAYVNDWFRWQALPTASSYTIQVSNSPLFTLIFDSATVYTSGYRNKKFTSGSTYFWRVRGNNIGGAGEYSPVWSFKVGIASRRPYTFYPTYRVSADTVLLGQTRDVTISISNFGTDTLFVVSVASTKSPFTVRPTALTLGLGQTATDTIRFKPTVGGKDSARIVVTSNSPTSPDTLVVTGFGGYYQLILTNPKISVGRIKVGLFKDSVISVSNTGNLNLTANIRSTNPAFAVKSNSLTIAAGQTSVDSIRFAPSKPREDTTLVIITSPASSSPDRVLVTGFGVTYGLKLNERQVSLGKVKVGTVRDSTITLTSTGTDELIVSSITSTNPAFNVRATSLNVAAGQSIKDTIRFTPTKAGADSARLVITSNAPTSPDTLTVSGFGATYALTLSAKNVHLGSVRIGSAKDSTLMITNAGNDDLAIRSITSDNPAFVAKKDSSIMMVGQSIRDSIRFSPRRAGLDTARIIIASNASSSPDTVVLTGVGIGPGIKLSSKLVQIGLVLVRRIKDTTFSLTNTGNDTLRITDISTSSATLSVRPTSQVLLPAEVVLDTMRFITTEVGPIEASIIIRSNAPTSPDTIKVTASGVTATTDVLANLEIPSDFALDQNYPNPFNPTTTIRYQLPKSTMVLLTVYSNLGQLIVTLVNGFREAGYYRIEWAASNAPSGVYFYRLQAGDFIGTRKMVVVK